jgi:hypothetical protein
MSEGSLAGVQYLDELFSAIRDANEQLTIADSWMSRADRAPPTHWRLSFLHVARQAHGAARVKLDEAAAQLAALGPANRLPSLLARMPERLGELHARLEASEKRLSTAWDVALEKPRGRA